MSDRRRDEDYDRHHRRDRDRDHERRKLSCSTKDWNRQTPPSYWNSRPTIPFALSPPIHGDRPLDWNRQIPPSYRNNRPTIPFMRSPPFYGDGPTETLGWNSHTPPSYGNIRPTIRFARSRPVCGGGPYEPTDPEFEEGSTTLGLKFDDDGIIVAVDHSWVSAGLPENVLLINSHLLLAFSGGTQISRSYLLNQLRNECYLREQSKGGELTAYELTVLLSSYLSCNPDSHKGLSLGILIAGWDSVSGSAFLFKVNGKGEHSCELVAGTGFGSASGRSLLQFSPDVRLRLHYAINMAKQALYRAVYRVPTSLEYLAIFHIGKHGVEINVTNESIPDLQKQDLNGRGLSWDPPSRRMYFRSIP